MMTESNEEGDTADAERTKLDYILEVIFDAAELLG